MKKTPFAITKKDENKLLVKIEASGIHWLIPLYDGLPLTLIGEEAFIEVSVAADWHKKELKETDGRSGNRETEEILRKALQLFENGELEITDEKRGK